MSSEDPNFASISKVKPALAGLLVDYKAGPKEITSTLVDLIVRGHLVLYGNQLNWDKTKSGLAPFEQNLLGLIFQQDDMLRLDQLPNRIYGPAYRPLIKLIMGAMVEYNLMQADWQKRSAIAAKELLREIAPAGTVIPPLPEASKSVYVPSAVTGAGGQIIGFGRRLNQGKVRWIPWLILGLGILALVAIWYAAPGPVTVDSRGHMGKQLTDPTLVCGSLLAFGVVFFGMIILAISRFISKIEPLFQVADKAQAKYTEKTGTAQNPFFLTPEGLAYRSQMLSLKEFMERYALKQQQLADEMVAYSVAMGIGYVWLRRMGNDFSRMADALESFESSSDTLARSIDFVQFVKDYNSA